LIPKAGKVAAYAGNKIVIHRIFFIVLIKLRTFHLRYEKCLASGLKPNWVLDKKERKRRREKKKFQPEKPGGNQQLELANPVSKANPMIW
jgi:hypothetical protein